MDSLFTAFSVIAPTFILLAIGYLLRWKKVADEHFLTTANSLVFKIFLPCMIFNNIYAADLTSVFNPKLFLFTGGSLLIIFGILCVIVPRVIKDRSKIGVVIQGIFRSNYVIFGISLVGNMFGKDNTATAAVLCALLAPMYNVLAVIVLAVYSGEGKVKVKNILKQIVTNPLIIAVVLALPFAIFKVELPSFLDTVLTDLAHLATPLALIVLGGDFDFKRMRGNIKLASVVVAIKLVVIPCIFIPIAVALGFRGQELLAVCLSWETPVAVSSYIMAQQAGADGHLAGQLVVLSSAASIVTVFLMIFILRSGGLI